MIEKKKLNAYKYIYIQTNLEIRTYRLYIENRTIKMYVQTGNATKLNIIYVSMPRLRSVVFYFCVYLVFKLKSSHRLRLLSVCPSLSLSNNRAQTLDDQNTEDARHSELRTDVGCRSSTAGYEIAQITTRRTCRSVRTSADANVRARARVCNNGCPLIRRLSRSGEGRGTAVLRAYRARTCT